MRPQLAVCALYPHFSRCVKTADVASIFRIFFTSLARVFGFLPYAFVNPSLDMWQLLFLIFSRPNSSHIHSESSLVLGVKAFLTEVSVKMAVAFFFRLHSYSCFVRFRKVTNVFLDKQEVLLLLK